MSFHKGHQGRQLSSTIYELVDGSTGDRETSTPFLDI